MKTCPICNEEFEPKRKTQVYCGKKACRDEAERQRQRREPLAPEVRAERALEARVLTAEAHAATARREAHAVKLQLSEVEELLAQARVELDLYQTPLDAAPDWLKPPKDTHAHHGTLVAMLSDTHIGEIVDPREMDGYNAYNLEIADLRIRRFFERTIVVARRYLAGVEYDGVVLALGGDLVSGDIHDELTQTNEDSTYEAVEFAVPRITGGISMLREEFGSVHVVSVPGNHGRNSKKPRSKRRSANNADTHIARLVANAFEGDDRVTFDVPRSFDANFKVYAYQFSIEHGDQLRFNGTSEIGALGPVKRGTLRKKTQASAEGRPFHYNLVGHFHQYVPAASQEFVMNGSVKGYDEFARTGHFKPEPAQQALMVVTPEHGITVQAPVLVQNRKDEGW